MKVIKMCADEQWKKAALMDDAVVAQLLLQLHAPPPTPSSKPALSIEWKVRQRRSKTLTVNSSGKTTLPRASPTTPLSWSGGTSNSACAVDAGFEECSQIHPTFKKPETSRSKVSSEAAIGKRPRKKKTLAELKSAELALEEERKQLTEEMKRMRVNLDREKSTHEKLKRLKLELESQTGNIVGGPSSSIDTSPKQCLPFTIPDLNLPLEDDCNIEVQCEAS